MKKLNLLVALLCLGLSTALAENYKILFLNSSKIKINNKPAKVGSVFNEKATIKWSEERQAMKVISTSSFKRYLMVAKLSEGREKTAYDILTRNRHLSTHDNGQGIADPILKLENNIANSYDLLDEIEIPSDLTIDEMHYFIGSYEYGDTKLTKKLKHNNQNIIIDRSIFWVDGKKLDPRDINLTIDYIDGNIETPIYIKGDIEIIIIPEKL